MGLTQTVYNNLENSKFISGKFIKLNGYLCWPRKSEVVQLNIISSSLSKLIGKNELRVDIAWNYDNSCILMNPHKYGMVKLKKGIGEVYCSADRILNISEASSFFKNRIRYEPIEIHWYGKPDYIFFNRIESQLLDECEKRGIKIHTLDNTDYYSAFEIEGHIIEIMLLEPTFCKSNFNQFNIIWEALGKRTLRLIVNRLKTDCPSGIILSKRWSKIKEMKEYSQILADRLNISLYFTDFSRKNWAKKVIELMMKNLCAS
jgi:hypothetical protein